jgi:hypothetical protein
MAMVPSLDVEMLSLRRSERIAKIQQDKERKQPKAVIVVKTTSKPKKEPRKVSAITQQKPKRTIQKKNTTKITKAKSKKAIEYLLAAEDLSQVKINHLFTLIKKYCPIEERELKYSILQTILKTYKQIGIKNTLQDLSANVQKVACHLSSHYNIVVVQDTLTSLLSFPELMLPSTQNQTSQLSPGLDDIIGMMANTQITRSANVAPDDLSTLFAKCCIDK